MLRLNHDAYKQAESLILQGKVDRSSSWQDAQPNSDAETEFVKKHGWNAYEKWFLAYDTSEEDHAEAHWQFLYGDFDKVYRSALLLIRDIAEANNRTEFLNAVNELIKQIDKEPDAVDIASEDSFPASDPPARA